MSGPPAGPASLLARLAALDTCALSDALDGYGRAGVLPGVRPLWPVPRVVVGRVRTLRVGPKPPGSGPTVHLGTQLIETAERGDVVLVDAGGRTDVSSWGGILSTAATQAGIAAIVIDGACRDIGESEQLGLPVFGKAVVPTSARGRIVQLGMDEEITVCGVPARTGDLLIADVCGAVVVPQDLAEQVVELAERIAARERDMVAAVRSGRSVVDVMHDSQFPSPQ
ncbi:RraA family protein [Geodermatophilus ruber]|uniref:Putative 4-hydroxy-4-methyl-2-oxoglutarate aldolase n=1 Tax=Geodermatophilus ruber TaxID=504800 RepID=A0A1I4GUS6_9ACTN|nr:4-carboxy-4-hydroxy-2-oxoadipate aldolase/oxaloacetate decarboxylase [Geodermatophilus ruber]SFL33725.1 Regulator of RNase E activity RraA [Geodermatophilus ruber]